MSDTKIYDVPESFANTAHLDAAQYQAMYRQSVEDPAGFWAEQADKFLHWEKRWDNVLDWDFSKGHIRWFEGGKLNACYNCIDRHLEKRSAQTAGSSSRLAMRTQLRNRVEGGSALLSRGLMRRSSGAGFICFASPAALAASLAAPLLRRAPRRLRSAVPVPLSADIPGARPLYQIPPQ